MTIGSDASESAVFVGQPSTGTVVGQIAGLVSSGQFDQFDAAVAYVTLGGVAKLMSSLPGAFDDVRKRWLVGIDWCRSEPDALVRLGALANSSVRVHDGATVVRSSGCHPVLPFHPKCYLLDGPERVAVLLGSANLSRNGLGLGHEADLIVTAEAASKSDSHLAAVNEAREWFAQLWARAIPYQTIDSVYRQRYKERLPAPTATEDDAGPSHNVGGRGRLSAEYLTKLRAGTSFWIDTGNMYANRGAGVSGNQLEMKALTRVFFGVSPDDVPLQSRLAVLNIECQGVRSSDRTLYYGHNGMDVLTLPTHGSSASINYDNKALLFDRRIVGTEMVFQLTVGGPRERMAWKRQSDAINGTYTMNSGRQFGVF